MQTISTSAGALAVQRHESFPGRPTIIFLHDSLGSIRQWRGFPAEMGARTSCNVLVYDRQGYGQSAPFWGPPRGLDYLEKEAGILGEVMEQCHIGEAILFGHSDGGSIALIAAAKYGERIRGIITEGAHIFVEDETLAGIRAAVSMYKTTDLHARLARYHGEKSGAVFRAWTETWTALFFRAWNIESFLPSIICPAFIIQGTADAYGTMAQVARTLSGIGSKASAWTPEGIGHSPHREAAAEVLLRSVQMIRSWLDPTTKI